MQRTITLYLTPIKELVETIEVVNRATNDILKVGFDSKTVNKLKLHHLTYYDIRDKYKIPASLVTTARDNASEMLKRDKCRVLPHKKDHSAIRYNARTFSPKLRLGFVSVSSIHGRIKIPVTVPKYFIQYLDWHIQSATLRYDNRKNQLVLSMIAEQATPSKRLPDTVLGVDTGIINHAVLSNNKFFNSNHIREVKGRYRYLRGRLQASGTRSAKRHLRKSAGREKRFMADVNHRVADWIVNQPLDAIAMEELNIVRDKKLGKRFNTKLGGWAFGQLQQFVEYKAEALGKSVFYIDARYTSQKCSRCGNIRRANRNGHRFRCDACGLELHADLNASRNIANLGKAEAGRPIVNGPIVAGSVVVQTTSPQLQAHGFIRG